MYKEKTILALIPARGGSKGVPRKHIRELGGKPMIAWTIAAAKGSAYIDRLVLSSEDEEIIAVAKNHGCEVPFVRPAELADDKTPGIDPVIHALETLPEKYDYLVLLQPTSPFRSTEDIDLAIAKCIETGAKSCVSVSESGKHPAWMYTLDAAAVLTPVLGADSTGARRQDLGAVFTLNGAIYVAKVADLVKERKFIFDHATVAHPMPPERSLDVDTEFDFRICQLLAAQR